MKLNNKIVLLWMSLIIMIASIFILPSLLEIIVTLLFIIIISFMCSNARKQKNKQIVTHTVIIIICLSAFQNIYLGLAIYHLSSLQLQVLLSCNIAIYVLLVLLLLFNDKFSKKNSWCGWLLFILFFYSLVMFALNNTTIAAFIASFRNVLSPLVIYLFSVEYSKQIDESLLFYLLEKIIWIVIVFGLIEYFIGNGFWNLFNVKQLWNLKGISTNIYTGLPNNWYSSEIIGGNPLRRMVSTFFDPVNLGTFLFASFMITWYKRKKILSLFVLICCILTVSKGALLGFLIFIVVYFWYKDKHKIMVPIIVLTVVSIAVLFLSYSFSSSTGSVMAHINGFISSLEALFENPLGYGVGRVGVLSTLLTSMISNSDVVETGIGVVIAQLGIIGLIVYFTFFLMLFFEIKKWKNYDLNSKILYYSLLYSFILNAMFNEVALSPNSCTLYFVIMGLLNYKFKKIYKGDFNDSIFKKNI